MSINCELLGRIPYEIHPSSEFQAEFDISAWLGSDTISSVAYSAVDENNEDASSDVLDAAKHANTNTVVKPWIKGGGTHGKSYSVVLAVTTANGHKPHFVIEFDVFNVGKGI